MAIEPKKEPLEEGKEEVKAPKKKVAGKKAEPKKLEKVNILEGIEYNLTEVSGRFRTSDTQTHLLEIHVGNKLFKIGLSEEPTDVDIKKWHDDLDKRK